MATSLSNLDDNLPEGIHKIKRKDCDCFLEYESFKDNLIKYRDYLNKIDEKLEKQFKNTFKFSSKNQWIYFVAEKVVYPYDYMMNWKSLIRQHYQKNKNFMAT